MLKHVQLSGRERVRLALEHKETDRIPIAMVCSGINEPAYREVDNYLRRERQTDLERFMEGVLDIQAVAPQYVGPPLGPGEDIWGVVRKAISYGPGSYDEIAHYPLAQATGIEAIQKHTWPTTALFDYSVIPASVATIQKKRERCLMIANANPFESAWYMRGFERMLMDFALNPQLAHEIMERVTDFHVQHFGRMLEAADGSVDLAFTADDIAGQNGLLISLEMWEEFIKPYHLRLNKRIHEFGVKVIYHSDGAVLSAVAGLIDAGIDVLQALQFDAKGMDPAKLKAQYGDQLCFEGGVSVQKSLPFGRPEDVRLETRRLIRTLGKNGGYILGPSHAVQAGTPVENIMAMFDTALSYYPFA
jgi:uroporphyrinogen decarboxylase